MKNDVFSPLTISRVLKRFSSSQLSYIHGVSTEPFLHETIGHRLLTSTEAVPNREAFIFRHQNIRKTYEQLYQDVSPAFFGASLRPFQSERLALGLLHLGLKKGDRVGMWGPNFYEWVTCQFATALAGLVMVSESWHLKHIRENAHKQENARLSDKQNNNKAFRSTSTHHISRGSCCTPCRR